MAGFYKIEAVNKDTNEKRVVADWFPNLITDQGLNAYASRNPLAQCMVGSGANPPTVADSTLQTQIAAANIVSADNVSATTVAPFYGSRQRTYRFNAGVAAGNLSEVGVGWLLSGTYYCFSRALILDSGGFPTTITILANEFLDVTYELRCYVPTVDVVTTVSISGTPYTCTIRPGQATVSTYWAPPIQQITTTVSAPSAVAYAGPISALVTGQPSGVTGSSTVTALTYENNSLTIKAYAEYALNSANFAGGIQSVMFYTNGFGAYQIGFSPAIPKDITKTFRFDYGVSWARR